MGLRDDRLDDCAFGADDTAPSSEVQKLRFDE
jgi:hypothetical protein